MVGFRCVSRPSWGFTPRKPAQSPVLPGTLPAEGLGVPWGCGLPRGPWEGSGGLACSRSKIERSPADFLPTMAGLNPRAAGRHRKGAQVSASESLPDTNMTLSPGLLGSPVGSEPQTGGRGGATLPLVPSAGHPGGLPGGCGSPLLQKYLSWGGESCTLQFTKGFNPRFPLCMALHSELGVSASTPHWPRGCRLRAPREGLRPHPCRHLHPPGPRGLGLGGPEHLLSVGMVAGSAPTNLHLAEASGRRVLPSVHLLPPGLPSHPDRP